MVQDGATMKNAPVDEPNHEPDSNEREDDAPIVAGVGSSALGMTDIDDEDTEPQRENQPDNDGETVER